jgi:hypothetical protein
MNLEKPAISVGISTPVISLLAADPRGVIATFEAFAPALQP